MPPIGLRAPILAISSPSTGPARLNPPPPYSVGQVGVPSPWRPCLSARLAGAAAGVSAEEIAVGNYGVSANGMPFGVALHKGYFKAEGLNITAKIRHRNRVLENQPYRCRPK
jgi:hypothetical protein